ncbi:MAG TPA: hypothetical protein VM492_08355 [Sumerlaeia bacterium]|nr:hypothetical protein [Sumerlaeia bacterium]
MREICLLWAKIARRYAQADLDRLLGGIYGGSRETGSAPIGSISLLAATFEEKPGRSGLTPSAAAVAGISDAAVSVMLHHGRLKPEVRDAGETNDAVPAPAEDAGAVFRKEFHSLLDRVDRFLLEGQWETPPFTDAFWMDLSTPHVFDRLALLAVVRASLAGDEEKGVALLEGFVEALRIMHFAQHFHWESAQWQRSLQHGQSALFTLGQIEAFPDRGLEIAREALAGIRLSKEQIADLRHAQVYRWREVAMAELDAPHRPATAELDAPQGKGPWWGRAVDLERQALRRLAKPIIVRDVDRFVVGLTEGRPSAAMLSWARMQVLEKTLSRLGVAMRGPSREVERAMEAVSRLHDDEDVQFAKLVLATVRFHRDHGRWPGDVSELIPAYLDPSFAGSDRDSWGVCVFDRSRSTIPWARPGTNRNAFNLARVRFLQAHHRSPDSFEELRPFFRNEEEYESFRPNIGRSQERPIFFRLHRSQGWEIRSWEYQREQLGPMTNEEKGELDRLKAEGADRIETVRVTARCPVYPLISDELVAILGQQTTESE